MNQNDHTMFRVDGVAGDSYIFFTGLWVSNFKHKDISIVNDISTLRFELFSHFKLCQSEHLVANKIVITSNLSKILSQSDGKTYRTVTLTDPEICIILAWTCFCLYSYCHPITW